MKIDKHADNVVESFKRSLNKEQLKALGDEAFEELQILIEAAIGDTVSKALHDVAKDLEKMAKTIRKRASSIDQLEQ